ncbi:hypothetical protein CLU79DRAFT_831467 [Phycomyces nitens]|nr:hypothetical protein CLU79DRAFT_831467 [Phycomyces nitens]
MKQISFTVIQSIYTLLQNGKSCREIARELDIAPSTVSKYRKTASFRIDILPAGRRSIISKSRKELIRLQMLNGEFRTSRALYYRLLEEGYRVSYPTVCNIMKDLGLKRVTKADLSRFQCL